MKKNELKSGMIVEYRNGVRRLVVGDNLVGYTGNSTLSHYDDELKLTTNLNNDTVIDIVKVYNCRFDRPFNSLLKDDNLDLIWERKDIRLTVKEVEILKALKTLCFGFLARDKEVHLYAYSKKPYIIPSGWFGGKFVDINNDLFNFIKWTDKEPTSIDNLLKGVS